MRRAGNLWPAIVSFENLRRAAIRAANGKRTVAGVARFLADLEPECLRLQRLLESGEWRPGKAFTFEIHDPDFIRRILLHLGLPTEPPSISPARPPPSGARNPLPKEPA